MHVDPSKINVHAVQASINAFGPRHVTTSRIYTLKLSLQSDLRRPAASHLHIGLWRNFLLYLLMILAQWQEYNTKKHGTWEGL